MMPRYKYMEYHMRHMEAVHTFAVEEVVHTSALEEAVHTFAVVVTGPCGIPSCDLGLAGTAVCLTLVELTFSWCAWQPEYCTPSLLGERTMKPRNKSFQTHSLV